MDRDRLTTRQQGDRGEQAAVSWLWSRGAYVFVPFGHSPDFDLIAAWPDGRLERVQVKTATHYRSNRWEVMVATRGGNQSWNRTAKLFSSPRCDRLFVLVGDGRQWYIPATEVGAHGILLGGPKFARYEVDRGRPIVAADAA